MRFNVQGKDASHYTEETAPQNAQHATKVDEEHYATTYGTPENAESEETSPRRERFRYLLAKRLTPPRAKNANLYISNWVITLGKALHAG